jgi:hypothetical protein
VIGVTSVLIAGTAAGIYATNGAIGETSREVDSDFIDPTCVERVDEHSARSASSHIVKQRQP